MHNMDDLRQALDNRVSGTYEDFVQFCIAVAKESQENLDALVNYILGEDNVTSSDVIEFIVDQGLSEEDDDERDPDEEYDDDEE